MSETTSSHYEIMRSSRESIPVGLRLNKLDDLVGLDKEARADYARDKENLQASYDEYADTLISTRLRQNGIEDDANDETRHSEYEYAKGLYANVSKLSEVEWLTTPPNGDVKRRTLVLRELLDRYDRDESKQKTTPQGADLPEPGEPKGNGGEGTKTDDDPTVPIKTPEKLKNMDLEALAHAKHEAFAAKVNGPAWGKEKDALMGKYEAAEAAYLAALKAQIETEITADGYDVSRMKEYIEKLVNDRAATDADAQHAEIMEQGGVKAQIMERYANLSRGQKIMATVGIAGIGAVSGALLGTIGAGAAFIGVSVAAIRFGTGYGRRLSKIYAKDKVQRVFTFDNDRDASEQANEFLSTTSLEKIKEAEKIKKRAVYGAMGAVAFGGALAVSIHTVAEASLDHWPAGLMHHIGNNEAVNPSDHSTLPGSSTTTNSGGLDTNPSDNEGYIPDQAPQKPEFKILGSDEHIISRGEGWYETLREMGVSSQDRAELLKEVGPHLHDKGLAYWDSSADEWRMNMTENSKLPKSAIEYIARMAHENGIHSNYDKFFEANTVIDHDTINSDSSHEFSEDAQYISKGEGFYHELGEMGVSPDHQAEVLQQAAPELYEQGIAHKMSDGLPGINMTSDHIMPQESLETLHQAAIDSNVSDNFTTTHEGIVFDQAADAMSTTTTMNGEFSVNDFGKSYDAYANSYYHTLKGVDRPHWQALLNEAAPKLQAISYDGEPLTFRNADGWHFREVTQVPPAARKILSAIADKHNWTFAA